MCRGSTGCHEGGAGAGKARQQGLAWQRDRLREGVVCGHPCQYFYCPHLSLNFLMNF